MAYLSPNNAADYDRSDGDTEPLSLETAFTIEAKYKVGNLFKPGLSYVSFQRIKLPKLLSTYFATMSEKALTFGNIYDVQRHDEQVRERVTAGQELQKKRKLYWIELGKTNGERPLAGARRFEGDDPSLL